MVVVVVVVLLWFSVLCFGGPENLRLPILDLGTQMPAEKRSIEDPTSQACCLGNNWLVCKLSFLRLVVSRVWVLRLISVETLNAEAGREKDLGRY